MIDVEDEDVADFQYLVGQRYIDDENGFSCETTRVVLEHGLILFYRRVAVQADDTTTSTEEDDPIFVKE